VPATELLVGRQLRSPHQARPARSRARRPGWAANYFDWSRTLNPAPLDQTVLDQLRLLRRGDGNFALRIVGLFLDTTPSVLNEIESAASVNDMAGLRIANHRLLSASAAIGALRLTGRCEELDRMLRNGLIADAGSYARVIAEEYGLAETALENWCAGREVGRSNHSGSAI
jgi:HPt (histidine-containing phosphotransfer) domain-containing protein